MPLGLPVKPGVRHSQLSLHRLVPGVLPLLPAAWLFPLFSLLFLNHTVGSAITVIGSSVAISRTVLHPYIPYKLVLTHIRQRQYFQRLNRQLLETYSQTRERPPQCRTPLGSSWNALLPTRKTSWINPSLEDIAHPSPQSASLLQVSLLKPGPYPTGVRGWGWGVTPRLQCTSELSGKTVNSKLPRVSFEWIILVQWRAVCYSSVDLLPGEVGWGMWKGGGRGGVT